jgi:hypothetical protein
MRHLRRPISLFSRTQMIATLVAIRVASGSVKTATPHWRRVTSAPTFSGFHGSLTVIAFTNAAGTSVVCGLPVRRASRISTCLGSSRAIGYWRLVTIGIGRWPGFQSAGRCWRISAWILQVEDTVWVQSTSAPSSANGLVEIRDTSPTNDQWNAAIEIVAARQ